MLYDWKSWLGAIGGIAGVIALTALVIVVYFALRKRYPANKFGVEFIVIGAATLVSLVTKLLIIFYSQSLADIDVIQGVSGGFYAFYHTFGGFTFNGLFEVNAPESLDTCFYIFQVLYTGSSIWSALVFLCVVSAKASYELYSFVSLGCGECKKNIFVFTSLTEDSLTLAKSIKEHYDNNCKGGKGYDRAKIVFAGSTLAAFDRHNALCREAMSNGFLYWSYSARLRRPKSIARRLHLNNNNLNNTNLRFAIFSFDIDKNGFPEEEHNIDIVREDIMRRISECFGNEKSQENEDKSAFRRPRKNKLFIEYYVLTKRQINHSAYKTLNDALDKGKDMFSITACNEANLIGRSIYSDNRIFKAIHRRDNQELDVSLISFGETGQAIAKALYSYSADFKSGNEELDKLEDAYYPTDFVADAYDPEIGEVNGIFEYEHPYWACVPESPEATEELEAIKLLYNALSEDSRKELLNVFLYKSSEKTEKPEQKKVDPKSAANNSETAAQRAVKSLSKTDPMRARIYERAEEKIFECLAFALRLSNDVETIAAAKNRIFREIAETPHYANETGKRHSTLKNDANMIEEENLIKHLSQMPIPVIRWHRISGLDQKFLKDSYYVTGRGRPEASEVCAITEKFVKDIDSYLSNNSVSEAEKRIYDRIKDKMIDACSISGKAQERGYKTPDVYVIATDNDFTNIRMANALRADIYNEYMNYINFKKKAPQEQIRKKPLIIVYVRDKRNEKMLVNGNNADDILWVVTVGNSDKTYSYDAILEYDAQAEYNYAYSQVYDVFKGFSSALREQIGQDIVALNKAKKTDIADTKVALAVAMLKDANKHNKLDANGTEAKKRELWKKLDSWSKESNMAALAFGNSLFEIIGDQTCEGYGYAQLCNLEHQRWLRFHIAEGWRYGWTYSGNERGDYQLSDDKRAKDLHNKRTKDLHNKRTKDLHNKRHECLCVLEDVPSEKLIFDLVNICMAENKKLDNQNKDAK